MTAIFSPEHGFRGTEDAGATVSDSVDEKTGVPILSLYSDDDTHSPSAESMAQFDTLVVDMQDVGLRYYTYYLSMYYLMDACASAGKNSCKLTVIPCKNYTHQMKTSIIRNPSPNIKDMRAVYLYASTCFAEEIKLGVLF